MVGNKASVDFESWYRTTYPRLVASLTAAFGDVEVAHDAASEAMAQTFQEWSRVSAMTSSQGWTYRVAVNLTLRRLRRKKIERRLLFRSNPITATSGPAGEIWHVVADLPERQRMAVVLRHVGHLSERDIGETMGIARGTVSATLRSAYSTLRIAIEDPTQTAEVGS